MIHYNEQESKSKYLISGSQDYLYGIRITSIGFQCIQSGAPYPPKEHPNGYFFNPKKGRVLHEYQLLYITKGHGYFQTKDSKLMPIAKGSIILLEPGMWHTYYPDKESGWNEYYIGFDGEYISSIIKNGVFKNSDILQLGLDEQFVGLFTRALEIAQADKVSAQSYLSGILMHIIGKIQYLSDNKSFEMNDAVVQKIESAKIIMHEQIEKEFDPEVMAVKLDLSYSWFRKTFKDYTGYAPGKYFMELKIARAKELLLTTDLSMKEIAYRLNFNSSEHFLATFKKYIGITPLKYRLLSLRGNALI